MKRIIINERLSEQIEKEIKFFETKPYISYSGMNKLLYSPILYYRHYILNERDDADTKALIEGRLIHCLLLTPEKFNEEYQIISDSLPSDNVKKVIDTIYQHYLQLKEEGDEREDLIEFSGAILDVLEDINLYQSLKTDEQRIAKIVDLDKNLDYWFYLKNSKNKTLIEQNMYDFAVSIVDIIKQSINVKKALGIIADDFNTSIETHNEIYLRHELKDYSFNIHGILDNLVIDHLNKTIKINDFKTTSKDLNSFKETIEFYRYWLQIIIYILLVINSKYYKEGYKIEARFIVADVYQQVGTFLINDNTIEKWYKLAEQCFEKTEYHIKNKAFDLPYEFLIKDGEVIL